MNTDESQPSGSAFLYLALLSFQRLARVRQMVWIAISLLAFTTVMIALVTSTGRWGMEHWRSPRRHGHTYQQWLDAWTATAATDAALDPAATGLTQAVLGGCRATLEQSGLHVFSRWVVFLVFVSFLLPIWSLSFATEALGGEREGRHLVWLLTRPMSRPAIYLAKFAGLLPWSLALNLGGFAILCLAGGTPGRRAFVLYWPAVAAATLAFSALFHLMSACFRRAAVIAIVYSFFLETVLGNMPGHLKRASIGFYTRCLMFDAGEAHGISPPEKPTIYMPVDAITAWWVLAGGTLVLLALGMVIFARKEYQDE